MGMGRKFLREENFFFQVFSEKFLSRTEDILIFFPVFFRILAGNFCSVDKNV